MATSPSSASNAVTTAEPPIVTAHDDPIGKLSLVSDDRLVGLISLLVLVFLAAVAMLARHSDDAADFIDTAGNLGSLLIGTIGAIATIWWFSRRDPLCPRVSLSQECEILSRIDAGTVVQISAVVENVGDVPIEMTEWRLWLLPVEPLPDSVLEVLNKNNGLCIQRDLKSLDWGVKLGDEIGRDRFGEVRLRPGERQQLVATALIPPGPTLLRVYSFFPHKRLAKRVGENRGWTSYSLLRIKEV